MLVFIGEKPLNKEINHKNGIKTDNRLENLEYISHLENMRHAFENNLIGSRSYTDNFRQKSRERMRKLNATQETCKGEKQWAAKLTEQDVLRIRADFKNGASQQSLCQQYNVSRQAISNIVTRKNWNHI